MTIKEETEEKEIESTTLEVQKDATSEKMIAAEFILVTRQTKTSKDGSLHLRSEKRSQHH